MNYLSINSVGSILHKAVLLEFHETKKPHHSLLLNLFTDNICGALALLEWLKDCAISIYHFS